MGWPPERGGEPGLFVALLRGGVGLCGLWTGGAGEGIVRLRCAAGALGGGVRHAFLWAFTGLFGAGRRFEAGVFESIGRGGYWLRLCSWFWPWLWLGLHR